MNSGRSNNRSRDNWLWYLLAVLFFLPLVILGLSHFQTIEEISLLDQLKTNSGFVKSDTEGIHLSFGGSQRKVEVPVTLPGEISRSQKIRIDYAASKNFYAIKVVIPDALEESYSYRHLVRIVDKNSGSFTFGLNETNARYVTLVFYGDSGKKRPPIDMTISSLSVSEKRFIDSNLYYIFLLLSVSSSLVFIGILSGSVLRKYCNYNKSSSSVFLLFGIFSYSLVLLSSLLFFQWVSPHNYSRNFLYFIAILTTLLIVVASRSKLFSGRSDSFAASVKVPVVLYLVFSAVVAFIVCCIDGIALQEYNWTLIGEYRMFGGHTAHDNVFQYLNALAIAENKPFNYFYKAPQLMRGLMFAVEDRQILMGALLGAYSVLWGHISPLLVNGYGFFLILGSCFSLLIIFPLYGFFRIFYHRYIVVIGITLLLMNTYVLGNIYYTWFKILGGGCILAGIYFLHFHTENLKSWVIAGVFFGIAVNIHTGQAIVYPVIAMYFFYQYLARCPSATVIKAVTFAFVLTSVVVIAMLPWELIKHSYFPNKSVMFRTHFLHGQKFSHSILQTTINFFSDRYTFAEQILHRSEQLVKALRLNNIQDWYANIGNWDVNFQFLLWNKLQYRYITIMVYPLLILLSITVLAKRCINSVWTKKQELDGEHQRLNSLLMLSVGCVVWGLVIMHTTAETISSSFVSQYATLFIVMYLHCKIASYSRLGLFLMYFYGSVSFAKLYVYFSKVLFFSSLLST